MDMLVNAGPFVVKPVKVEELEARIVYFVPSLRVKVMPSVRFLSFWFVGQKNPPIAVTGAPVNVTLIVAPGEPIERPLGIP
jgi:hypothetical protein